jgi:hypothetical protein
MIDLERICREAGLVCAENASLGSCVPDDITWLEHMRQQCRAWDRPLIARLCNAVLEEAATRCKDIDAYCGGHGEPSMPGSSDYMQAIRALRVPEKE